MGKADSSTAEVTVKRPTVPVSPEDAEMIKKVRKILCAGKNAEIKQDSLGHTKVFKVSREIEK